MKKLSWALSLIAAILMPLEAFAWFPLSNTIPQYEDANGNPYSGAVLKAYTAGTSTPITMATDSAGGTTVSSIALNASGYPAVSGNVVLPYLNEKYKLALYPTQTAADANSGAIWTQDNIAVTLDFGSSTRSISTTTALTATDKFTHIEASGTITINLPALSSAGTGFVFTIRNASTGLITLDPSGAETINGSSTIVLYPGDSGLVQSGSSSWSAVGYKGPQAEVDIASAATTNIGAAGGMNVRVTGTTGITSFGTAAAGLRVRGRFQGAVTLTYNAASMILNTGTSNYTTAANDRFEAFSLGSGNWLVNLYRQDSNNIFVDNTDPTKKLAFQLSGITTATTRTVIFPDKAGTVAMTSDITGITLGTPVATTSGTSTTFTLSGTVKQVVINFQGFSTSSTSIPIIQIGPSGGVETSSYVGATMRNLAGSSNGSAWAGSGIALSDSTWSSTYVVSGSVILTLLDSSNNIWAVSGTLGNTGSAGAILIGGNKTLAGALNKVTIKATNGTDTFTAGSVNVAYQ
jgi:hypothetical protein